MAPFVVFLTSWIGLRVVGRLGVAGLDSGAASCRVALAVMFVFTGSTHFSMRQDYLAMLPGFVPREMALIYATGALEIAGAIGLLVPATRRPAGMGLMVLLLLMFPANVFAALEQVPFRGEPPTSLWLRAPIQAAFLAGLWWSGVRKDSVRAAAP